MDPDCCRRVDRHGILKRLDGFSKTAAWGGIPPHFHRDRLECAGLDLDPGAYAHCNFDPDANSNRFADPNSDGIFDSLPICNSDSR